MSQVRAIINSYNIVSPLGTDTKALMEGLYSGKSAIRSFDRFVPADGVFNAAFVDGLDPHKSESLLMQMIDILFANKENCFPVDSTLIFASTVGEIDLLEGELLDRGTSSADSVLTVTAEKIKNKLGLQGDCLVVSAACASSTYALARAKSLIASEMATSVVVVAADIISEFVYSGFASLLAMDKDTAKPFDLDRSGLSLGEAAAYVHLLSDDLVKDKGIKCDLELMGAGMTNDANHMTGPSRTGEGLARAIKKSISTASVDKPNLAFILAHGTGTRYNDSMELKAFKSVWQEEVPLFSIKGAIGHTMGNAGLAQLIVAAECLKKREIPKSIGVENLDPEAQNWVSLENKEIGADSALLVNAGFGGINAAVLIGVV